MSDSLDLMGNNPLLCHEIFQVRILEWVAISYSQDLPNPGIKPTSLVSPALASGFFTIALSGIALAIRKFFLLGNEQNEFVIASTHGAF